MLHPLLLWFLPLAAVPLILHLITLFRLRTVDLSTFRFLMEGYVQQRRRMKLLEWLLMLLRTAFVALIVLMLSRPVIEKYNFLFGGQSGRDVVLIIDAGVTSGLQSAGSTSLGRAKQASHVVVEKLAPSDYVTLIRAGSRPQTLYRGYLADSQELLQKLDAITADIATCDLAAALTEGVSTAEHGPRVVYVVSDLQRRSWLPLEQDPIRHKLGSGVQLVVMNVGSSEPVSNLALVGDPPRMQRPIVNLPVQLSATVASGGNQHPVDTRVSVVLDDQVVGQMNVTVRPGQPSVGTLVVNPSRAGLIKGRFELPADAFPEDDRYEFCLNVEPQIRVLLVTTAGATPLEDPAVYLRVALASPLLAKGRENKATEEKQIAQSLAVTAIRSDQLSESHLATADVVVAADMQLDAGRGALLRKHLDRGGGLLVFAGPHVDPGAWLASLLAGTTPRGGQQPLVSFGPAVGNLDDEASFRALAAVDTRHPVLSIFDRAEGDFFSTARLYRYLPLRITPPIAAAKPTAAQAKSAAASPKTIAAEKPPAPATPLMKLADGTPVMAEVGLGAGRILLCSFSATPDWSNLPTRATFVPLLLRSIVRLRPAAPVEAAAAVRPHEPAPIQLSSAWQGARVQVRTPGGQIRPVELHAADGRLQGAVLDTDARGIYTFEVQPPITATGEQPQRLGFAVNLDIDQADFAPVTRQQVETMFGETSVAFLSGTPDDPVLRAQLTEKREIWRWLIWGMFAVIGVEFFLSTFKSVEATDATADRKRSGLDLWAQWTRPLGDRISRRFGRGEPAGKA